MIITRDRCNATIIASSETIVFLLSESRKMYRVEETELPEEEIVLLGSAEQYLKANRTNPTLKREAAI